MGSINYYFLFTNKKKVTQKTKRRNGRKILLLMPPLFKDLFALFFFHIPTIPSVMSFLGFSYRIPHTTPHNFVKLYFHLLSLLYIGKYDSQYGGR
jgi:hypothetical protein